MNRRIDDRQTTTGRHLRSRHRGRIEGLVNRFTRVPRWQQLPGVPKIPFHHRKSVTHCHIGIFNLVSLNDVLECFEFISTNETLFSLRLTIDYWKVLLIKNKEYVKNKINLQVQLSKKKKIR